jgi:sRNA-binding carbon storage regulator CsrA
MLIISRKKDEKIMIADDIEITILEVGRNRVRFGVNAPKHIAIHTHLKSSPSSDASMADVDARSFHEEESHAFPAVVAFAKRR